MEGRVVRQKETWGRVQKKKEGKKKESEKERKNKIAPSHLFTH